MSEMLARKIIEGLARKDSATPAATADATASGGMLPGVIPLAGAMQVMQALWAAFDDWGMDIIRTSTRGSEVAVEFMWGGTHTHALNLPGAPSIPATGKVVWVPDVFIFTIVNERMRSIRVASPLNGGIPGMLAQLGVTVQ
ncbi:MAG: nuclear transport factor 2 family protein [Anaerolineae bacterium]|nr:nuclear transport factor 2 family protein [Anaerolineae bacterium]